MTWFDFRQRLAKTLIATALLAVTGSAQGSFDPGIYRITTFGATGSGLGELAAPHGIAAAPDGTIFVTERGNERVQAFTWRGVPLRTFGGPGSGPGQFQSIGFIACSADGTTLAVADTGNHRVQFFTTAGTYVDEFPVTDPRGILFGPDGLLYITIADRVVVHHRDGTFVRDFAVGDLNDPHGIALRRPDSAVVVADSGNGRVAIFNAAGSILETFATIDSDGNVLDGPLGVATNRGWFTYVSDTGNNRARSYIRGGNLWDNFDSRVALDAPAGLTVIPNGYVFVADTNNDRIAVFRHHYAIAEPYADLAKRRFRTSRRSIVIRGTLVCGEGGYLVHATYQVAGDRRRRISFTSTPTASSSPFSIRLRAPKSTQDAKRAQRFAVEFRVTDVLGQTSEVTTQVTFK